MDISYGQTCTLYALGERLPIDGPGWTHDLSVTKMTGYHVMSPRVTRCLSSILAFLSTPSRAISGKPVLATLGGQESGKFHFALLCFLPFIMPK